MPGAGNLNESENTCALSCNHSQATACRRSGRRRGSSKERRAVPLRGLGTPGIARRAPLFSSVKFPATGWHLRAMVQAILPDVTRLRNALPAMLEAVCAAREPLARDDIVRRFSAGRSTRSNSHSGLGSLFPVADRRLRPLPPICPNWLTNSAQWIILRQRQRSRRRLADYVCRQCQAGIAKMSRSSVLHGPAHLASRALEKDLANLLLDYEWIEAKLGAANVAALLVDYDLAALIHSRQSSRKVQKKWWHRLRHRRFAAQGNEHRPLLVRRVDWSSNRASLTMLQEAFRLSAHVLALDAAQVSSQLCGRLSPTKTPKLKALLDQARRSRELHITAASHAHCAGRPAHTHSLRPLHRGAHSCIECSPAASGLRFLGQNAESLHRKAGASCTL